MIYFFSEKNLVLLYASAERFSVSCVWYILMESQPAHFCYSSLVKLLAKEMAK